MRQTKLLLLFCLSWIQRPLKATTTSGKFKAWDIISISYKLLREIHTVVLSVMNRVVLNVDTNISTVMYTVSFYGTLVHAYRNTRLMTHNNMNNLCS
jgi:hypothetical protein